MKIDYTSHDAIYRDGKPEKADHRVVMRGVKAINYVQQLRTFRPNGPLTGQYPELGITVHSISV